MQLHDCFALGKNDKVSPHACCSEIFPRRSSAETRTISLKPLKDKSQSGELAKKKHLERYKVWQKDSADFWFIYLEICRFYHVFKLSK